MTAHTPGPWTVSPLDNRNIGPTTQLHTDEGVVVPQLQSVAIVRERMNETDANARLIAAAPELLDALQRAVRTIRTWHGMGMGAREAQAWALYQASPEMKQINAAIAKAEGR